MQAVLDHAIPYLHIREAFGQKIGHFQVCFRLKYARICVFVMFYVYLVKSSSTDCCKAVLQ